MENADSMADLYMLGKSIHNQGRKNQPRV